MDARVLWPCSRRRPRPVRGARRGSVPERSGARLLVLMGATAAIAVCAVAMGGPAGLGQMADTTGPLGRALYSNSGNETTGVALMCGDRRNKNGTGVEDSIYPRDLFTHEQCRGGLLALHWIGMIYMFLGLSIVCDEFFVPALEEMYQNRLRLDHDVAGATLMAAGGSAPELFTSLIGTFSGSSVGFGTIVGSAVFNVLFVIGACSFATANTLQLTAYPLTRDCVWYVVCLTTLAIFFSGSSPGTITVWEAVLQLFMYVIYIIIMIFNRPLRALFTKVFSAEVDATAASNSEVVAMGPLVHKKEAVVSFQNRLTRVLTQQLSPTDILAFHCVHTIPGDVYRVFTELDTDGTGRIGTDNIQALLQRLGGHSMTEKQIAEAMRALDKDGSGDVCFEELKSWYKASESRLIVDMDNKFTQIDTDNSGYIDRGELEKLLVSLGFEDIHTHEIDEIMNEFDGDGDGQICRKEFANWYRVNPRILELGNEAKRAMEVDEEGLLSLPESWFGRFMFILTLPLVLVMVVLIPDVRRPGKLFCTAHSNWYLLGFLNSILVIGGFSFGMIWFATTIGTELGIPDEVMGLTLLAAGTSVPDLLSSVAVAREGHGDMAVSSSIGSNIFDVTVGLPIPWIMYTMFYGKPSYSIGDSRVGTSVVLLILMLATLLGVIVACKWRMTKVLGVVMFSLYAIFVTVELLRNQSLDLWPDFQIVNF